MFVSNWPQQFHVKLMVFISLEFTAKICTISVLIPTKNQNTRLVWFDAVVDYQRSFFTALVISWFSLFFFSSSTVKVQRGRELTGVQRFSSINPVSNYERMRLHRRILGHLSAVYCIAFDRTGLRIFTVRRAPLNRSHLEQCWGSAVFHQVLFLSCRAQMTVWSRFGLRLTEDFIPHYEDTLLKSQTWQLITKTR